MPSNRILTVKASAVSLKCVAALRLQWLMVAGLGFGFFHAGTLHVSRSAEGGLGKVACERKGSSWLLLEALSCPSH